MDAREVKTLKSNILSGGGGYNLPELKEISRDRGLVCVHIIIMHFY